MQTIKNPAGNFRRDFVLKPDAFFIRILIQIVLMLLLSKRNSFIMLLLFIATVFQTILSCSKPNNEYMPSTIISQTDTGKTYLALGDSYTIGESVAVSDRYPVQAVKMLKANNISFQNPEIIATTGWMTADLLSAVNNHQLKNNFDLVSLLIGVNNQYQGRSQSEYNTQFTTLLQKSIQLAGNNSSHVIVLSIPDYSVTPFARGSDTAFIAKQIDSFNLINKTIAEEYKVRYINVTDESRKAAHDASLIAGDGLHFSGKEYSVWASMLVDEVKKMQSGH